MHFEEYPELTEVSKKYLLDKPFTKGINSVEIKVISAYLDDEDIALKATKLPPERFKKILSVYAQAWRHKMKNCNKTKLRIDGSKKFTSQVMISATHSWSLDVLWEAVNQNIPAPQETKVINRTNRAKKELHTAQSKRGVVEDEPIEEITFENFMKNNRPSLLPYLKEQWEIDSQNSSVSPDRETRIYPEAVKFAKNIYSQMYTDKLTIEEKITLLYEKKKEITQSIKSKHQQVLKCSKAWEKAIKHMAYLEQKHKEYIEQK